MDRLRAYEVFVAVVKRGSFTRAADALDTSPANVTRYIVELEAHLGTRLLNRTSRRLSLTSGGEALYERCAAILDDLAETEALVVSSTAEPWPFARECAAEFRRAATRAAVAGIHAPPSRRGTGCGAG
jgi:DNA-binding transcriptional LysR family regulator